jgi:hypothetical protein
VAGAVIATTRPWQWPKNLLVFAAPLAAASLGQRFGYALVAMFARRNARRCLTGYQESGGRAARLPLSHPG